MSISGTALAAGLPPAELVLAVRAAGHPAHAAPWVALAGGRTNRTWRFGPAADALVCKLFDPAAASVLFPNDIDAEARALKALTGTGLAPRPVDVLSTAAGRCLIYRHVAGTTLTGDAGAIAGTLRKLHRQPPPAGLRRAPESPAAILAQGEAMLRDLPGDAAARLAALKPSLPETALGAPVFLHGDAVPANVIASSDGPVLIDWQCPALGDATEDLATFLSPAMQLVYGAAVPTRAAEAGFLDAYGAPDVTRRFRQLERLYHWRMAAHCLWRGARGDADYLAAAEAEIACL